MSKIDRRTLRRILTALHLAAMAFFLFSLSQKLPLRQYPRMEMFAWIVLFIPAFLLDKRRNAVLLGLGVLAAALLTAFFLPVSQSDADRTQTAVVCGKLMVELLTLLLFALVLSGKRKDTRLYPVAVLLLGLVMMFVITPMSPPDEVAHYQTAMHLSRQLFFRGDLRMDASYFDYSALAGHYNVSSGYYLYEELFAPLSASEEIVCRGGAAAYIPEYLVPTIALFLAQLLNANFITAFMMGRFANLLFFTACVAAALYLAPEKNKRTLGLIALLPIVLQQAASFSYDAFILGLALLYAAEILRARSGAVWSKKDRLLTAITVLLLAPTRAVYILLLFLLWILPKERFGKHGRRLLFFTVLAVLCVGLTLYCQSRTLSELSGAAETGLNWEGKHNYTLSFVLAHPGRTAVILWNTLVRFFKIWFVQMHGYTLSGLSLNVHLRIPALMILLLLCSVSTRQREEKLFTGKERLLFALLLILSGGMMMGVMMLAWTSDTSEIINGVQGRYFLPVLPLFYLMLENRVLARWAKWEKYYLPLGVYAVSQAAMDVLSYTWFH